ncbi:MAG: AtpZ/AtpI family protein [Thermoflexales bacterium]|nr:AtpZ/AtpI family protein [Thermoflexales bacterium]
MKKEKDPPLVILSRALPAGVIAQMVLRIGFAVVALVFGSVLLGLFIDTRVTNTKPLFTLLLSIIGAIASVWVTYKLAMGTVPRARKAYEDWAEAKKNNGESA